jgi:hypothetical protein
MHCLYCKKRLWLFFIKGPFCSKLHEVAYHDEQSGAAMHRLMESAIPVEPPAIPAALAQVHRESKIPRVQPVAVPSLCNFFVERDRPKPVALDLAATAVLPEAEPFTGLIQFPSSSRSVVDLTLDSATQPAGETRARVNETNAACRLQSRRSRRIPPRSPAEFSLRTHRRRVR